MRQNRLRRTSMLFVLFPVLFVLAACGSKPVPQQAAATPTLVITPTPAITPTPTPPTMLPFVAGGKPYPLDYEQFCKSVPATVCLFYPAGAQYFNQDQNGFWAIDFLLTDQTVCLQTGGYIGQEPYLNGVEGCIYYYPSRQSVNFVPPPAGFKTSGWCNPQMFTSLVDEHGAVQISDAGAHNQSGEEFCFLQVILNR